MTQVIGIKFRDQGQVYYFQSSPFVVEKGDSVIVKTEEGLGLARVILVRDSLPEGFTQEQLKPIFRLANEEDLNSQKENQALLKEAFKYCRERIKERNLDMKLVDVEVYFDRSKIIFYFTAPGRVDFRDLVKDMVKIYKTRIELRQIGVRHETQMIGGLGNCGQVCCCRKFMRHFDPVTIKMAKDQNLFLNPAKIS
ncbi:MAG: stage 0 sporulation family protein, partial [Desulfonatronovibrio sp.]